MAVAVAAVCLARAFRRRRAAGTLRDISPDFRDVDPRELRVPSSRQGADPVKLARQIAQFGASPLMYEGTDGVLVIDNGVTRATRIAKLAPGATVRIEVIGRLRRAYGPDPKIGDLLP